jgi:hypothetical protein
VVYEQQRAGGVGLKAPWPNAGLDVEHDALVAEADPEVLEASVPTAGLRQELIQLVIEDRRGVPPSCRERYSSP